MVYNAETKEITISCREFVTTARRGISSSFPCNDDEPSLHGKIKSKNCEELFYTFEISGHAFKMTANADSVSGNKITLRIPTDSSPKRPKKELVAQARGEGYVTAFMLAQSQDYDNVFINYQYINYESGEENSVEEIANRKKLTSFFEKCKISSSVYAKPEIERVTRRLPSMKNVKFPYGKARGGQSELIQSVYKNIARGGTLFATAPTGTGKTVSVLFPAVRALGAGKCDKVFYFTPKTTTVNAARDCIEDICKSGADIRALIISSKERACKNGVICREGRDKCENSSCKRLSDALLALYNKNLNVATSSEIGEIARDYKVCPHELSLSYAELSDIVICDLNYLFDTTVYIRRFFDAGGNYAFLIDEAHNLPERAREIYSAEICEDELLEPLTNEIFGELSGMRTPAEFAHKAFREILFPYVKEEIYEMDDGDLRGAVHLSDIPSELYDVFDSLISKCEDEIYKNYAAADSEKILRANALRNYYYKLKKFRTAMGFFDNSYEFFIFLEDNKIRAKCFCIDPGRRISCRLEKGRSAIFFSGTLSPMYYYKAVLGGDGSSDVLSVESPFDSSQLSVSIMDKISTRFSEREDTLLAVCKVIAATVSAKRGNYMIFSPSFAYSNALAKVFAAKYPKIKVITQRSDMTANEKKEFLSAFKNKKDDSYLIGFCVMGGIYSEGVDLSGDSLIGAVIVGIGIPSLSYEREAISAFYNDKYDEGKQFAYIYPGMNRVLQAAGRVIRSENDKGVIVLIDDRFDDPIYKKVIPNLWNNMKFISTAKDLRAELDEFWEKKPTES